MYLQWRHAPFRSLPIIGLVLGLSFCSDRSSSPDVPPAVAFSSSCSALSCTFQDKSSDPDGTIVNRTWNFGDGSTSPERAPVHVYATPGTYAVTLTVGDEQGESASQSEDVTVEAVAGPASETVLIAAGDIAGCASSYKDEATAALLDRYPGASIAVLGDNAYPDGTAADYGQCYQPSWGRFKDRTYPTPGNHDYHVAGAPGYFDYFGARAGPEGRGYYSYDLGSWHIISLNSEIGAGATSAQAAWLKQDLADHPAQCTLAYWHRPFFTSGATHHPETAMRSLFTILFQAGAELVLSGHNHQYERFAPQQPDGTRDDGDGIRYFVAGTGGAALYDFGPTQANSEARYQGWGVLKLTLGSGTYEWEFIPVAGATFSDSGSGQCH